MAIERPKNYREESDLRERVGPGVDWEPVTDESRRVFLATFFPLHPRLHLILNTFADYRAGLFRQPHRIDHHCHLQNLHVQAGHLRQILGFLTRNARDRGLVGGAAWQRLLGVPLAVHEMQRCGGAPDEICEEVLDRWIHPFLRDTGSYPHLFRLVMQTFYSDHNRLTPPDEIARTKAMLEGLIDYVHIPRAVELDVWSDDLIDAVRAEAALSAPVLARIAPKRQLVVVPIDGRARPETVAQLEDIAGRTEAIRTGQLLALARQVTDDERFREVLRRARLRLSSRAESFIKRWTQVFLSYYDDDALRAVIHPATISNKVLHLFLHHQLEREAAAGLLDAAAAASLSAEISAFLPRAKGLMKDSYAGARRYAAYLEVARRFRGECLLFEAHPAAQHFDTSQLDNEGLFELMMPVYRVAAAHGLTGVELNRGEAFNEMVLETAERLGLYLSVGSDFHSLSLSRTSTRKSDREYGCVRGIPAALFRFPNLPEAAALEPLQVARSIGRLVDDPIPDETYRFGHWRRPRTLSVAYVEGGVHAPGALHVARRQLPPYALPAGIEERTWSFVRELERRFVADGLEPEALSRLVEYVLRTQRPLRADGDTPAEVAWTNSLFHGVRALELLVRTVAPEPPPPLAVATLLHDIARAYGKRDDTWYERDYERHKDEEQRLATVVCRRVLNDVLFPRELHAAVLFLVAHHERGSAVRDKAIARANTGFPVERMRAWCRAIDLADTLVFFEPVSIERYLRRRGEDNLRRKISFSLDLSAAERDEARRRVGTLRLEGRYSPALAALLDEFVLRPLG